jgi:hypothetical protein
MQISQSALFWLCCASFLLGLLLALFYDLLYMTRLWTIPPKHRYCVPTIQKLQAPRIEEKKEHGKAPKGFRIALFVGDVFFCFVSAVAMILLLYWLNNGTFRAAAPLCAALGFGLWRISVSKVVRIAFQWLAFILETVIYTLLLPFKHLFKRVASVCRKNAQKKRYRRLAKQRENYTKQHLQNINRAAERLLPINIESRMQKGDRRAKARRKKAV